MNSSTTVRILDHRTAEERDREFLPGTGSAWMLPVYDAFSRFSRVRPLHDRVAALADIAPGESVLDVGCGTANLSLAVLRAQPDARVTGLDPDGRALRTAARKASRRRIPLTLVHGFADRLPADDGSLDHIISALAMHHVPEDGRISFAGEAFRALRPGGTVTIVDLGGSDGAGHAHEHGHGHGKGHGRGHGRGRSAHSAAATDPRAARGLDGGLVRLLADAGFADAREVGQVEHRFGPITFVQATRG